MKTNEFNKNLMQMGRRYEECLKLKNTLKTINIEDIINSLTLMKKQKQHFTQGCIERTLLLEMINNYTHQKRQQRQKGFVNKRFYELSQLQQLFPHNKIAYTTLVATCIKCIKGSNQSVVQKALKQSFGKLTPIDIITQIVIQELQINSIRKKLIPFIPLYIPMTQKNLTLQELKDYLLICPNTQYRQINPKSIILGLNGFGGNSECLQYEFYSQKQNTKNQKEEEESSSDEDETIMRIQEVMERLNKRVDNFGNQWLINK